MNDRITFFGTMKFLLTNSYFWVIQIFLWFFLVGTRPEKDPTPGTAILLIVDALAFSLLALVFFVINVGRAGAAGVRLVVGRRSSIAAAGQWLITSKMAWLAVIVLTLNLCFRGVTAKNAFFSLCFYAIIAAMIGAAAVMTMFAKFVIGEAKKTEPQVIIYHVPDSREEDLHELNRRFEQRRDLILRTRLADEVKQQMLGEEQKLYEDFIRRMMD